MRPPRQRGAGPWLVAGLIVSVGCAAFSGGSRRTVPDASSKNAPESAASPPAAGRAAPEEAPSAPNPPVLRVGLESDLSELVLPPRGAPWTLIAGGKRTVRRGPLTFRPAAAPAAIWRVQVAAFSEETAARDSASRASARFQLPGNVVFSAEKGLYRVRLGEFSDVEAARAAAATIAAAGEDAIVVVESRRAPAILVRDEAGEETPIAAAEIDVGPPDGSTFVEDRGKRYRGWLRVLANPRGLLNVVNVVNVEDYLRGVVPAEMGPRRFDELEALKAQAVAARTYALDALGSFEAEGYDLCATPKCQAYGGREAEDPLSDAAVEATRGLVARYQGKLIHALFSSTCGGRTEDVSVIFPTMTGDYLKGVDCGEADATLLVGAGRGRRAAPEALTRLEWRGEVLLRKASTGKRAATRAALWREALQLSGVNASAAPPSSSAAADVYPALISAFGLARTRDLHLTSLDRAYDAGPPDAAGRAPEAARAAYETLLRMNFGGEAGLPPVDRRLNERELSGLLFSVALRLGGIQEISGRFVRREGGALILKTGAGRVTIPADASMTLARRVGEIVLPAAELSLRTGDPVKLWKRNGEVLSFCTEFEPAGATFEKESSWAEWVRRVSGRELMLRARGRVAGTEVRAIEVMRRGASGRAIQARLTTDQASLVLSGFDLRQALGLPDLLFSVVRAAAPDGSPEFVFLGRGWGHGVGFCQNGAYGMALAGRKFDEILKHYYTGIDIAAFAPAESVAPSPALPPGL